MAWPQWPAYISPQPAPSGPGPSAQANAWPQWPPNIIPQLTPLSSGSVAQGNAGPLELQNPSPPPAAYNTLLQAKPQYSLFTATPMPVPSNAIATEPPQVAHNIGAQILAGADIDLSSLLSLLPTSDSNRQIDCGDFSVTLKKNLYTLISRIIHSVQSIHRDHMLSFPHRRHELNDYLAIIAELALSYGGGHFFTYHKLFSAKCAVRVAQWNQCPYWGALDLDLHSRVFLGCRNIACAVCRSVAHSTSNCPRINPSATPCPEPTSAKSTSYVPRPATVPYSDHETTAPYAADNRQPCFSFNNRKCGRPWCRYLHICSFCGGAHARVVCSKLRIIFFKNYLSTPVNIPRLATELTHHPDREFREYLLLGLSQGFNPGIECALSQNHICNNLQSAHADPDTVNDLIAKEVKAGFMIGPFDEPPFKVFRISPIGLATRKFSGKKRLIIDLSSPHNSTIPSINSLIPLDEFSLRYHDIEQAVELVKIAGRGAWLAKLDITSALKVMTIHPDSWHLFGILWERKYYFAVRLTFGCKSSPKIFNMLSEAICWILSNNYAIPHLIHLLILIQRFLPRSLVRVSMACPATGFATILSSLRALSPHGSSLPMGERMVLKMYLSTLRQRNSRSVRQQRPLPFSCSHAFSKTIKMDLGMRPIRSSCQTCRRFRKPNRWLWVGPRGGQVPDPSTSIFKTNISINHPLKPLLDKSLDSIRPKLFLPASR